MESIYLRSLIEVVKAGSFSSAAQNLCVTQSAVSRRIKFLEDQYGYGLIDRSGAVLVPTEAGKIVIEKAELMLTLEQELLRSLRDISANPGITFSCTPAFGIAFLPEVIKKFMLLNAHLQDLKFFFDTPEKVIDGLRCGSYEIGVIEHCECFDLTDLLKWPLPDDEMLFVSSPKLELPEGEVDLDELLRHTLFGRKDGCCSKKFLALNMRNIGREGSSFAKSIIYDDLQLIIQSVVEGLGIAFVSRAVVNQYLEDGRLRQHRIPGFGHTRRRSLVAASPFNPTPPLVDFISCVGAAFGMTIDLTEGLAGRK